MDFELGEMTLADYDGVVALWRSCAGLGQVETRDELTAYLERNPGLSVVAREADRVVGAVLCGHDGRRGYLYHLAVAPAVRGRGLARRIVTRCLDRLHALGIGRCTIHLYVDNADGERFWRQAGWRERTDLKAFAIDLPARSP